ncbi:MAG: hypothetical protein COU08_03720 [Candidatus Harrisonbacteria bacterium CG10_big_fil_rev_8_21_14_0_10_42_17]|uniref:Bacterial type II secretion system protein E domain-containing protein n=1 Tax=Candidatus Harrisonbacteria bacterium CG10_big_fil_rev_8_21_14_0_10_42_17 TaxID=1974584 RepID=A0A2M6WH97_9BACT|nr:MAG: hypothetical protein COU08_03720 [Candidatus Harrisonbacteria bacterium CG10_big_fil_rev_8_21_14_0_10_42_17]
MNITKEKLRELVVPPEYVAPNQFEAAVHEAEAQRKDVMQVLVEKDLIKDEQLGEIVAEGLGFQFVNLRKERVDDNMLDSIPEPMARAQGVIAFGKDANGVRVGMVNPDDIELKHLLEKKFGQKVIPFFITRQDLINSLSRYESSLKDDFEEILKRLKRKSLPREMQDNLVVEAVDTLLRYGYQNKASDIHIEPLTDNVVIRFRIDGVLHDILNIDNDLLDLILTRIKILAKMRTDEHASAQDGRLTFKFQEEKADVRVSIIPISEGEKAVLRILSSKSRQFSLSDLGLRDVDLVKVRRAIKNPHGMILVTGPTGSGKTTTVYAVLKILNVREVNIATIEDPVEYDVEGVSQIQVNSKTNLTFALGLRAIMRQDPDIIMVGEIRDEETANISINAALTGHLVLSTLHANDAATTLPRLLDMNIEPFLVASTVNIAIAQRLVRRICYRCVASYQLSDKEKELIRSETAIMAILEKNHTTDLDKLRFYHGVGCKTCGKTGYSGRIGIYEILEMSESIKDLIIKRASSDEITKAAVAEGMSTMTEDGIEKVFKGITSIEEVLRVTKE